MGTYRSIMVISGETKPAAHAAAARSDVIRHGRLAVFHFDSWSGKAFEAMLLDFGEKSGGALSLSDFGRPLRSTSRVMTSQSIHIEVESHSDTGCSGLRVPNRS